MRIKNWNSFIKESLNTNLLKDNQKVLRKYIKVLKDNDETITEEDGYQYNKHNMYISYFTVIHNFLFLEEKYYDHVKATGKEINNYLDLPKTDDLETIINLFSTLYDSGHQVRYAVETLDSIEEVRQYLIKSRESNIDFHNKVHFKLPQL